MKMLVLMIALFQIQCFFSMIDTRLKSYNPTDQNSTIDIYMKQNNISTPPFTANDMIAFFQGSQLQDLSSQVTQATDILVAKIIAKTPQWQNPETTVRIMDAQIYAQNIAILQNNKEIVDVLYQCLIPIPVTYAETTAHFKVFWYALWKKIIPKTGKRQIEIQNSIKNLLSDLIDKRQTFLRHLNVGNYLEDLCKRLTSAKSLIEDFLPTICTKNTVSSPYHLLLQNITTHGSSLEKISQTMKELSESYLHLKKRHYLLAHQVTETKTYPDYKNIFMQWKTFWTSPVSEKQVEAALNFGIALENYITFLDNHLTKAQQLFL